ncbi:hypothetical protein GOV14_01325 [Candidatus Pacearchaeota archaeon]|nr:hypothetical protein [Candidatus Pacearchaeota archaeon]
MELQKSYQKIFETFKESIPPYFPGRVVDYLSKSLRSFEGLCRCADAELVMETLDNLKVSTTNSSHYTKEQKQNMENLHRAVCDFQDSLGKQSSSANLKDLLQLS